MMFPLAHALLSAGGGDSCIVPSNWQQVGTPYAVPTTNSTNGAMVANNETDVTYGDRSDRIRRIRWNDGAGTWSEPGAPFVTSTSVRSPLARLTADRIVYYSDLSEALVTLDWDEDSSSYSVASGLTTPLSIHYSAAMCGLSETRIAIATQTSTAFEGLALMELADDQWQIVGNVLNVTDETFSSMCALDENTVVYCPESGSPKVYRHNGDDWVLLANENGASRNEPSLSKVNSKTVSLVSDSASGIEFLCFDEEAGTITVSGDTYPLPGTAFADYYYGAALTDNLIPVFDRANEMLTMYSPNA